MKIVVLADHRWNSGAKTYTISATLSFLKIYELLKSRLKDLEIKLYVTTFNGSGGVDYHEVDFDELYKLYKEGKIKEILELAIEQNYHNKSKKIGLDDLLTGLSSSDFKFISSAGFGIFDRNITKENLDRILSEKRNFVVMVHSDLDGNLLMDLWNIINRNELKNIKEETKRKIYNLFEKRIHKGYLDDEDQKELIGLAKYLFFENNEEARELREKYGWLVEAVEKELYILDKLKYGIVMFPTNVVRDSNERYAEKVTGSKFRKAIVLDEPMFMISLWKNYKDEIKAYKDYYVNLYKEDKRIKLIYNGRIHPEKGINDLIKLYEDLLKEGKDVMLIIITPDMREGSEEYEKLKEIINKYKRGEVHIYSEQMGNSLYVYPLHLIGFLEAMGELKNTTYINAAYIESYGLATLEALIFGKLPIIYRDISGLRELKERGILINELSFKTYEDLYNLVKKVIGEIESGRFNINKYINEEKRKELIDLVDPERVAEIYAEIIYNYIKENYNVNLENQKVQESNVNL